MSADPAYPLQAAIYGAIKNIADGAVFERVPANQPLPYIAFGNNVITADYDAADLSECSVLINVLAASKSATQLLVREVRAALDLFLQVDGFVTMEAQWESTRYITQPDGLTEMAAIEFRYLLQSAN